MPGRYAFGGVLYAEVWNVRSSFSAPWSSRYCGPFVARECRLSDLIYQGQSGSVGSGLSRVLIQDREAVVAPLSAEVVTIVQSTSDHVRNGFARGPRKRFESRDGVTPYPLARGHVVIRSPLARPDRRSGDLVDASIHDKYTHVTWVACECGSDACGGHTA